jgi:hypothetical protein
MIIFVIIIILNYLYRFEVFEERSNYVRTQYISFFLHVIEEISCLITIFFF